MRNPFVSKRSSLLAHRACDFRASPSWSEAALWRAISGRKLGVSFRRQAPVGGNFIADFLAPSAKLIVEVDGGVHHDRVAADARRDRVLARLGYRVLRLPAELVLENLDEAVARIRAALEESQ
jgi:very-short-patch-repair endonuclease